MIAGVACLAFPVLADYHSTRSIARRALSVRQNEEPIVTYRFFHHTLGYYTGYQVSLRLPDAQSLKEFALSHPRFLVVAEVVRLPEFQQLPGFSVIPMARQGKLLLLQVSHR